MTSAVEQVRNLLRLCEWNRGTLANHTELQPAGYCVQQRYCEALEPLACSGHNGTELKRTKKKHHTEATHAREDFTDAWGTEREIKREGERKREWERSMEGDVSHPVNKYTGTACANSSGVTLTVAHKKRQTDL